MKNTKLKIGGKEYIVDYETVPYMAIRKILTGAKTTKSGKKEDALNIVGEMHDATLEGVLMMLPAGTFESIEDMKAVMTWAEYRAFDVSLTAIIQGDEKKQ